MIEHKRYGGDMQFTLAHLSDVHLGPLPPIRRRQLLSKRITGYINWQRNRAHNMGLATLNALTDTITDMSPDHTVVTGDLTNLALEAEFQATATWLKTFGAPDNVSIVPGNHDAYTPLALERGLPHWAPWLTDDDGIAVTDNHTFPYTRRRDGAMIIGCSSAVATPAFVAAGRFGSAQAERLKSLLRRGAEEGLFRVVLIHHPPVKNAAKRRKRLHGISEFQSVVRAQGAELVLHGHTHLPQRHWIEGPATQKVPVFGVPAASEAPGGHRPAGAFNLFTIAKNADGVFTLNHEEWSVTSRTGGVEKTEENRVY